MVVLDTIYLPGKPGEDGILILVTSRGTIYQRIPAPPMRLVWWPVMGRPVAA